MLFLIKKHLARLDYDEFLKIIIVITNFINLDFSVILLDIGLIMYK